MAKVLKFKAYCAEHEIKQKEIADVLGIKSVSNVSLKINGKQPWTLEQVQTLCQHYGISADIFLP